MSKRKSYFAFNKSSFIYIFNSHGIDKCGIDPFIDKITKKQFDIYKKENYGNIEVFESEDDCRKYAKDLLNSFINKKEAIKQSFLDTFSKEFCHYLFSQNLQLTENYFGYCKDSHSKYDYLFLTEFLSEEDLETNKYKLMIVSNSIYGGRNKIFDINNNKTLSINLKVEISE